MAKDDKGRVCLKLDRRNPKRRKVLIKLPPMPLGDTLELRQGKNDSEGDYLDAPLGTRIERPRIE